MPDLNIGQYKIIYGSYENLEKRAVDTVYGAVSAYVEYTLTAQSADDVSDKTILENNLIFIGTEKSNKYIGEFIKNGFLAPPTEYEGYSFKVDKSPFNSEKTVVIICGFDSVGTVYCAMDFENYYIPFAENSNASPGYFNKIFKSHPLPEYSAVKLPKLKRRGLWTWGHVIYDYKGYLDNMLRLKMNTVIIWNDFLPVNIKEVTDYAHSLGIKIICGYAWGWDTSRTIDISDPDALSELEKSIVDEYETVYSKLDIDGIYFQSFTETTETSANGVIIADAVVKLINAASNKIFDKFGDVEIMFGLHATSVADKLEYISKTDERIHIIWEDCGAFPYHYIPQNVENFDKTIEFVDSITNLRGDGEKFGAVLKGLICLDWDVFQHQSGPFVMGHSDKNFIENRFLERKKIWDYVTSYWLENVLFAKKGIGQIAKNTWGNAVVTALVEDGLFEYKIPFAAALMGELLFDSDINEGELLRKVSLRKDVYFK